MNADWLGETSSGSSGARRIDSIFEKSWRRCGSD
jgi:hypothetical protein